MAKHLYLVKYTFEDFLYFTSKEENRSKIVTPILHNIGLQYAFHNVHHNLRIYNFVPSYIEDYKSMNIDDLYIYPAIPIQSIQSHLQANMTSVIFGWQSDLYRTFSEQTKTNMLQYSNVQLMNPENIFIGFMATKLSVDQVKEKIAKYIRIGKLRSKVKIELFDTKSNIQQEYIGKTNWWINPNDLPPHLEAGNHYYGNYLQMLPNGLFSNTHFNLPIDVFKCQYTIENKQYYFTIPVCEHFQHIIQ